MRFKTKPRQNPKGDQLGTWDFRDNVWDLDLVYLTDIDIFNELKFITSGRKHTKIQQAKHVQDSK